MHNYILVIHSADAWIVTELYNSSRYKLRSVLTAVWWQHYNPDIFSTSSSSYNIRTRKKIKHLKTGNRKLPDKTTVESTSTVILEWKQPKTLTELS